MTHCCKYIWRSKSGLIKYIESFLAVKNWHGIRYSWGRVMHGECLIKNVENLGSARRLWDATLQRVQSGSEGRWEEPLSRALLCAFRQSCTWDLSVSFISNGGAVKANFKHSPGALVSLEQDRWTDGPSRSLRMGQLRSCCCLGVTVAPSDSTALPLLHTALIQLLSLHKDGRALSVVSLCVLRMFDTYFSGFVF